MTIGDWNCLSEESEAMRNLSIIIQISPNGRNDIFNIDTTLDLIHYIFAVVFLFANNVDLPARPQFDNA